MRHRKPLVLRHALASGHRDPLTAEQPNSLPSLRDGPAGGLGGVEAGPGARAAVYREPGGLGWVVSLEGGPAGPAGAGVAGVVFGSLAAAMAAAYGIASSASAGVPIG